MNTFNRRQFLNKAGMGFGALSMAGMMNNSLLAAENKANPLAPKLTDHPARAKRVIFLFMEGGPSHLDSFDPKPLLNKMAGKPVPPSIRKNVITAMGEADAPILGSKRKWKQCGKSGLWMSDWMPHLQQHADDLCVIRSMHTDGINHAGGVCQMNTGTPLAGRPSLGSWVSYGLGSENNNLPSFLVMKDSKARIVNGPRNWGPGFMPALYQGVNINNTATPISNLNPPKGSSAAMQRHKLDFLKKLNENYSQQNPHNSELDARIRNYELAYRMQSEAPEAVDISSEPEHIKEMNGLNDKETQPFGNMCLRARRLAERGVRFIQLYSGAGCKWDAHDDMEKNHSARFKETDQPISALLTDLKQRGMLEDTLVVWGGEFGRTPMSEKGDGRDHNPTGFTMWMAGGGTKGGQTIGRTDEFGLYAIEDKMHVHDLHATIMSLMGIDHTNMVYQYKGRPERIDQNEGHVNTKVFL
ncbi:MAG: DUF1501 domain-containing protein [Lentisphaeraceae bacterium]|nr:DUF1501 domain-containing protein [Lentisphaeraceae bacterium]